MKINRIQKELATREAFNKQSPIFDKLYGNNPIIRYKRERVRNHVLHYIKPGNKILELNAGTGEDAVFFAQSGFYVHATDISEGMQEELSKKVQKYKLNERVTTELCSFTNLSELQNKGPYDLIFSNFAGLNCTDKLDEILQSFPELLKPGGIVILTLLPRFCIWEILLALKGNFKTAFRRFYNKNGASAHIEGLYFKCWYYNPGYILKALKTTFNLLKLEGLCAIVPPSYLETFPFKYPKIFAFLVKYENRNKSKWPWKFIGDYYIISLKAKNN